MNTVTDPHLLGLDDPLVIAGRAYRSRLLVGTGKYKDFRETRAAIDASGAQIITVAIRRTNIGQNPNEPSLLDHLPPSEFTLLPNVRETIRAAEILVKDGFEVMVYTSDDPIVARELEAIGCVAIMPLASLIGSGMGILNPWNLQLVIEHAKVPVLVDAGVGTASDAAIAMELGCAGVLMNTAIAAAQDPVRMARAMKLGVQAGREAYLAGRMPRKLYEAQPSSPTTGLIG